MGDAAQSFLKNPKTSKSCPACFFEKSGLKNKDHPFDMEMLEKLAEKELKDLDYALPQIGDAPNSKTPRIKHKQDNPWPSYTQTYFKNFICKYQMPKRCNAAKCAKQKPSHTSGRTQNKSKKINDEEYLHDFIAQIKETNSEERQSWLQNRLQQKMIKQKTVRNKSVTNADREFIYAVTAMEFFWMQSDHHCPKPPKHFAFAELVGDQDLSTFTPGSHWHVILKEKLTQRDHVDHQQYQNDLRNLIKCWCTCCTRLLMKDFSHPGLIENCVDRKVNFNNVTFLMLKHIFGLIPEVPGPFQPATLMEAFVLRLTYESKRLQKFEQSHGTDNGIEQYFRTKYCTNLNYAIKAFLLACKIIDIEGSFSFSNSTDFCNTQLSYIM